MNKRLKLIIGTTLAIVFVCGSLVYASPSETKHSSAPIIKAQNELEPTPEETANPETLPQASPVPQPTAKKAATTSASAPADEIDPEPAPPVLIVSYEVLIVDENTKDCKHTSSDGTSVTFRWETTTKANGAMTTNTNGTCDKNVIGKPKGYSGLHVRGTPTQR